MALSNDADISTGNRLINTQQATGLEPFPPFDCTSEMHSVGQRWEKYVKRFENFTRALCIKDDERKRAMLLHYVGEETNDLFETLDGTGTTYAEAVHALNTHFMPLVNVEFETYRFRMLKQWDSELIEQFYTRLRKSSALCDFQNTEREIKSQLIIGSTDNKLRRYALKNPGVTLTDLVKIGKTNEVSERHSREIEHHIVNNVKTLHLGPSTSENEEEVNYVNKTRDSFKKGKETNNNKTTNMKQHNRQRVNGEVCANCGGGWHVLGRQQCRANGVQCRSCGKYNHFARVCLSKKKGTFSPGESSKWSKTKPTNLAAVVEEHQDPEVGKSNYVFNNHEGASQNKVGEGYTNLTICNTPITFLIDSGASVNIISKLDFERIKPQPILIPISKSTFSYGQNKPLPMQGQFQTTVIHNHNKSIRKITEHFQVSMTGSLSILSKKTSLELELINFTNIVTDNITNYETYVEENFPKIFQGIGKCKQVKVKLQVDSDIPPVANKHRRIPFHLRELVEKELNNLEKANIIEKLPENTITPWVSPIVVVPKDRNFKQIRICVDMREPNKAILRERHLTPTLDELIHDLNGAKHFSKVDLKQGYHQLILDEQSRYLTTFTTHVGLYRYKRLSFGINAAAERFQNAIQNLIQHIPRATNISDDILVYGHTKKEHDESLIALLKTLSEQGITLNKEKCQFNKNNLKFFGQIFSEEGIKMSPDKIEQIENITKPENPTELKSLLGMITFCNRYIPSLAETSNPLRKLLKKDVAWEWTEEQDGAFSKIVKQLRKAVTLSYFDKDAETEIWTDASPFGIAAILVQHKNGKMKVLSCASRTLTGAETRYAQIEREALAVTWAIEHFELYVRGSTFGVITDHQPLVTLFNNPRSKLSARLERWRLRLLSYDFQVTYKRGKENPADYLSRKPYATEINAENLSNKADEYAYMLAISDIPNHLSLEEIQQETRKDPMLQRVVQSIRTYFDKNSTPKQIDYKTYQRFYKIRHELITNFEGSLILKGRKIVIPTSLQERVINIAHQAHSGIVRTKQLLRTKVWFPDLDVKVEDKIKHCLKCQTVTKLEKRVPLQTSELPDTPWEYVHVDHKGPLPSGEYLLVLMDLYSRFPVVEVVKSTGSLENIRKLDEIFALLGTPKQVCTDNGAPYNSRDIEMFFRQHNIMHRKVTPMWPQANGSVERFNRNLNKTLQLAYTYRLDWKKELVKMLKIYRATPHGTTNVSPAELLFNRTMNIGLPAIEKEILSPNINRDRMLPWDNAKKTSQKKYHDTHFGMAKIPQIGDTVLLKQKKKNKQNTWFEPLPYTVMQTKGSMVTVARAGRQLTRNASHYRIIDNTSGQDEVVKKLEKELSLEEENMDTLTEKETNGAQGTIPENTKISGTRELREDHRMGTNGDGQLKGGHYLRRNVKPPERLIEQF